MEQYLSLGVKNYTASLSANSDENIFDEQNNDILTDDILHYTIPFWVGLIVISLLFLSIIIATIRYCFYTLCSSHIETERIALVPSKSPCVSSNIPIKIQRQKSRLSKRIPYNSTDENDTSLSSIEQTKDQQPSVSIIPINRHHSRSYLTSPRYLDKKDEIDHINNAYFSPTQISSSQISIDFRKRVNGIYVLPVSPSLSSSSTTINTDEIKHFGSQTMPRRHRRNLSSLAHLHHASTLNGIQNDCFTDSPKLKDRSLRFIEPPSQPPPLPPMILQTDVNDRSSFQKHSIGVDFKVNVNSFSVNTVEHNPMGKSSAPPVACRTRKPLQLTLGLDELEKQLDENNFRLKLQSSPQDDCSESIWPKPPDSMTTSVISRPSSISYDHLIPTIIMHQNSTTNFIRQHQHDENSMIAESET